MRTNARPARKQQAITIRTPDPHVSSREASLAHARAFLIYLKHRGVLNVDEFRRTNSGPVALSETVVRRGRPLGLRKRANRTQP